MAEPTAEQVRAAKIKDIESRGKKVWTRKKVVRAVKVPKGKHAKK